jgi:hypothetical protein
MMERACSSICYKLWNVARQQVTWQRPSARQYLCKYATVLEPFVVKGPRPTTEILLEAVFSLWSAPRLYQATDWDPCGGGFEYLHRSPATRRMRRKGESQIWDSKIWSRSPRDSDPRMTALSRPTAILSDRPILSSERAPPPTNLQLSDSNKKSGHEP